eukprot:2988779-Pyramimonas_sp.AAC.1
MPAETERHCNPMWRHFAREFSGRRRRGGEIIRGAPEGGGPLVDQMAPGLERGVEIPGGPSSLGPRGGPEDDQMAPGPWNGPWAMGSKFRAA